MGLCASKHGGLLPGSKSSTGNDPVNRAIERQMELSREKEEQKMKLLLLGAGDSGKSTIFKQMITLHGDGFSHSELMGFCDVIRMNLTRDMRTVIHQADVFGLPITATKAKERVLSIPEKKIMPIEFLKYFEALVAEPSIRETFERRSSFQLSDSCWYFFERAADILADGYVPTVADVLRCRLPTVGVREVTLAVGEHSFVMLDVGGQRSERRKWIRCFEHVNGILFLAAISEYDQVLLEDSSTSRLAESVFMFESICKMFSRTSMVLFLNKRDIFREKLQNVPLAKYFPDYAGGDDYVEGCQYMTALYMRNIPKSRKVYVHITCATDTTNVRRVFESVKDCVLADNLAACGLGARALM